MRPIQIDFDARVTAWEKNEAREASIMASRIVTHSRPIHLSTIETTPHNSHAHSNHNHNLQVWNPTPSPHTYRTSMDSRYPFVEILPRPAEHTTSHRLRNSSLPTPGSIRGGTTNTRAWVTPGGNPLTSTPDPAPIPAASQSPYLPPHRYPQSSFDSLPPSTLTPLLSPLSVAQGNDTTRLHYDLRTLPLNVRLSARDPTTQGAPERYLPRSDVRHLMLKKAFNPSLTSIWVVSSLFSWVIPVEAGHSDLILIDDVLSAIHAALHQQVTHREWNKLPQAQQQRITSVWEDALALSDSGSPPFAQLGPSSPWYTRLFPATATTPCCKPKYRRHANEAGILAPRPSTGSTSEEEKGGEESKVQNNDKVIVLRKRDRAEGVLRIDWVCGKTRWGGLVRDDDIARRRGVPEERWERTWCLVLE